MSQRHETCDRCHKLCVTKDDWLRGPLEGNYEYLCKDCAFMEGLVYPLKWKRNDPR